MAEKKQKRSNASYAVEGHFDMKAASGLSEKLEQEFSKKSISELTLDFSSATHITADGIAALKQLGEHMRADGKELIIGGMRSEMYKTLKIAGISDALMFSHRNSSQLSP